jgi:hypothetical protein
VRTVTKGVPWAAWAAAIKPISRLNRSSCRISGGGWPSPSLRAAAILPISVSREVATTTAAVRPDRTVVPANSMLARLASGASTATAARACFPFIQHQVLSPDQPEVGADLGPRL